MSAEKPTTPTPAEAATDSSSTTPTPAEAATSPDPGGLGQFLDAYDAHRVNDQMSFYDDRIAEYGRSSEQTSMLNETFLLLAGVCGAVAAVWTDQARWLGLGAVALAAIAGAVISWADVIGFSMNADLYKAATRGLAHLRPKRPEQSATEEQVQAYMTNVEEILLGEVRTWGQKWSSTSETSN